MGKRSYNCVREASKGVFEQKLLSEVEAFADKGFSQHLLTKNFKHILDQQCYHESLQGNGGVNF